MEQLRAAPGGQMKCGWCGQWQHHRADQIEGYRNLIASQKYLHIPSSHWTPLFNKAIIYSANSEIVCGFVLLFRRKWTNSHPSAIVSLVCSCTKIHKNVFLKINIIYVHIHNHIWQPVCLIMQLRQNTLFKHFPDVSFKSEYIFPVTELPYD